MWPTLVGTLASVTAVLAEARLGPRNPDTLNPSSWWGILPSDVPPDATRGRLAAIAALAVITLCLCWCALIRTVVRAASTPAAEAGLTPRPTPVTVRRLAATSLAWSLPFALGPPLFSRDVYAYAGQGELARHGLDPATHGISALRTFGSRMDGFVLAVDPRWRDTHAPYGGTAVFVEKTAATIGDATTGTGPVGAVLVLRLVAVASVVALLLLTLRLLPGRDGGSAHRQRTALVLTLLACNPVTVIHLVGGAHLDALAAALLVTALVVDRRAGTPHTGRPRAGMWQAGAIALTCLAGTIKATAFLGLAVLLLLHLRDRMTAGHHDPTGRRTAVTLALTGVLLDLAVAAATVALSMVAAGFGPTWIGALSTSGQLRTGIAPASLLAHLFTALLRPAGVGGHTDGVLTACRALSLAVATAVIAALFLRAWRNPPDPPPSAPGEPVPDDVVLLGVGGMAIALGSPVLYPWYLAPAIPALAVMSAGFMSTGFMSTASGSPAPRRAVTITSVALCVTSLASLAPTWRLLRQADPVAYSAVAAGMALGAATVAAAVARRRGRHTSR